MAATLPQRNLCKMADSLNMSQPSICIPQAKLSTAKDDKRELSDGCETFARDSPSGESQQSDLSQQSQHRRRTKTGHSSLRRSKEHSSSKESSDEPHSDYHGHMSAHTGRQSRSEEMRRMFEEASRNLEERLEARLSEMVAHLQRSIERKHGASSSSSSHRSGRRSSKSTRSRCESSKSSSSRSESSESSNSRSESSKSIGSLSEAEQYLEDWTAKLCLKPTSSRIPHEDDTTLMGTAQSDSIIQSKPTQQESAIMQSSDVAAEFRENLVCDDQNLVPYSTQRLFWHSSTPPQPRPGQLEVPAAQAVFNTTHQESRHHTEIHSSCTDHQSQTFGSIMNYVSSDQVYREPLSPSMHEQLHVHVQQECMRWATTTLLSMSLAQPVPSTGPTPAPEELGQEQIVDTLALVDNQCRRRAEVPVACPVPLAKMEDRFAVDQQDARIESRHAMVPSSITVPTIVQESMDVQVGKQESTDVQPAKLTQDIRSSTVGTVATGKKTNLSELTSAKQTRSQQISTPPVCNTAQGKLAMVSQPPSLRHSSGTQQVRPPVPPVSSCEPSVPWMDGPVVPRNIRQPTDRPMTAPAEGTYKSHQGFVGGPANPAKVHRLPLTYGNSYWANAHAPSKPPVQRGFFKISAPVLPVSMTPPTSGASTQVRKQESTGYQRMPSAQHPGASPMGIKELGRQTCHSSMPVHKQQRTHPVSTPVVCKSTLGEPGRVLNRLTVTSECRTEVAPQRPNDSLLPGPVTPTDQREGRIYTSHQGFMSRPAHPATIYQPPPTNWDVYSVKSHPAALPPPQPGGTQKPNHVSQVIQPLSIPAWNHPGVQPAVYPSSLLQPSDFRDHKAPAPYGQNPSAGPATVGQPWRSGECPPASYSPYMCPGIAPEGRPAHCNGVNNTVQPPRVPVLSAPSNSLQHSGCQRVRPPPSDFSSENPDDHYGGQSEPSSSHSSPNRCNRNHSPRHKPTLITEDEEPETPKFSGKAEDWENFDYMFQRVARKYRWDDEEKLDQLTTSLHGKALSFVRSLPPGTDEDFNTLMGHLRRRFRSHERPDILRHQLSDVRQRVDEDLQDFADRIREMASRAYRGYGCVNIIDDAGIEAFLRGLRDRNVAILAAARGPFMSIQAALDAAQNTEANQKLLGQGPATVHHITFNEPIDVWEAHSLRKVTSSSPRQLITNPQRSTSNAAVQTSISACDIVLINAMSSSFLARRPSLEKNPKASGCQ